MRFNITNSESKPVYDSITNINIYDTSIRHERSHIVKPFNVLFCIVHVITTVRAHFFISFNFIDKLCSNIEFASHHILSECLKSVSAEKVIQ